MKIADLYAEFRTTGLGMMSGKLNAVHAKLQAASVQMDKVARKAKIAFAISGGVIAFAAKEAIKFQKQLAIVSTMLSEGSMFHMAEYEKGLQRLSVQFGEATETLSKGLYDILSASVAPAKAMEVLEVAARAASAGITDTGTSADAITTIMNAYGMSADSANEISDKLFATVKRGKLTFGQLAGTIGKAAATAATAGLSLDELLATIATVTRAGVNSSQAMTAVVGVIRSFLKPTDEGAALAKELGFELNTASLAAEGLSGIMARVNQLSTEQVAVLFPNIRGLKAVAAAMQDLSGLQKDVALMGDAAGMTWEAFAKRQKTVAFHLGQMKQGFLDVARAIGKAFLPDIKEGTTFLKRLAVALKENGAVIAENLKWIITVSAKIIIMAGVVKILAASVAILNMTLMAGPTGWIMMAAAAIALILAWEKLNSMFDTMGNSMESWIDDNTTAAAKMEELTAATREAANANLSLVESMKQANAEREKGKGPADKELDALAKLKTAYPELRNLLSQITGDKTGDVVILKKVGEEIQRIEKDKAKKKWETEKTNAQKRIKSVGILIERQEKKIARNQREIDARGGQDSGGLRKGIKTSQGRIKILRSIGKEYNRDLDVAEAGIAKNKATEKGRLGASRQYDEMAPLNAFNDMQTEERRKMQDSVKAATKERMRGEHAVAVERAKGIEDARLREMNLMKLRQQKELEAAKGNVIKQDELKKKYAVEFSNIQQKYDKEEAEAQKVMVKKLDNDYARDQIKTLGKRSGALAPIVAAAAGFMSSEQKKTFQAEQFRTGKMGALTKAYGEGKVPPEYAALVNQLADKMGKTEAPSGQWMGVADLYRSIQSSAMSPELKLSQQQLDVQKNMAADMKKMAEEGLKIQAVMGA